MFRFFKYIPPRHNNGFDLAFDDKSMPVSLEDCSDFNVSKNIDENIDMVSKILRTDVNGDILVRHFKAFGEVRGFLVSADGLTNANSINDFILEPIIECKMRVFDFGNISELIDTVIPQRQVAYEDMISDATSAVNMGNAVLFVDGFCTCAVFDVKTWEHRGVSASVNESVVQGPHEAFNEILRCNTALVRKSLNNSNLIMDTMFFGKISKTPASLAYINGLINPDLLREIKRKLMFVNIDYVLSVFDIEKIIEERRWLLMPQIITTERPDKVSRALAEGRAALFLNGSSQALILPSNITDIIASPEDSYLRKPYSVFIKIIRLIAVFLSVFTPGLYLAVTSFHTDAILTEMLVALNAAGENVPFSQLTQVIIMEIAFELIKEAGVRIPGAIGSSLGIVGGLILGQSAVSAGLVSPIIIIVVSVCGISSFAIPSYSLSFSFRIARFIYIFAGALWGVVGIIFFSSVHMSLILGTKSFGLPACVPFSPTTSKFSVLRAFFNTHFNVEPPEYMKAGMNGGEKNE